MRVAAVAALVAGPDTGVHIAAAGQAYDPPPGGR